MGPRVSLLSLPLSYAHRHGAAADWSEGRPGLERMRRAAAVAWTEAL
jgi:hypothetical protein